MCGAESATKAIGPATATPAAASSTDSTIAQVRVRIALPPRASASWSPRSIMRRSWESSATAGASTSRQPPITAAWPRLREFSVPTR